MAGMLEMINWITILLALFGVFVAWVGYMYIRYNYLRRRRLHHFLSVHRVEFRRVKYTPSMGWPGYTVVFDSPQERDAFRNSPAFEALVSDVQKRHDDLRLGERSFDARFAVALEPLDLRFLAR